jgi:hypothetical protein
MTMRKVETLVVRAGQAGLAVSGCLTEKVPGRHGAPPSQLTGEVE